MSFSVTYLHYILPGYLVYMTYAARASAILRSARDVCRIPRAPPSIGGVKLSAL